MSIFKKMSDWNEKKKAEGKARRAEIIANYKAKTAADKAKYQERVAAIDAKFKAGMADNKAKLDAAKAELKAAPTLGEVMAQAKADYKAAKESPEYQELKAKSDKQCSVAWKMIKWGLILMLIGPVVACTGAVVFGVVAG